MGIEKFKYQESAFDASLSDESDECPFGVTPGCTKVGGIRKPLPSDPKLYVLQDSKRLVPDDTVHSSHNFY